MDIVEFYRQFLRDNHVIEKEGTNSLVFVESDRVPVQVGGKTLVLPTEDILKNYTEMAEEVQIFHPLCENTLRKDSIVFNFIKRLVRTSLTVELDGLFHDLVNYTSNAELSKSANKKQREIVKHLTDIDEKSLDNISKVLEKVEPNSENKLIDFSVQRGREIDGTKYARVCYFHLPLYHELHGDNQTRPFGVKLRKKDVSLLIALHQVVFGKLLSKYDGKSSIVYEMGTQDSHAPNFVVIATMFNMVKDCFRKLVSIFEKQFNQYDYMEGVWVEHMDKIQKYRALVPAFPGNDGEPAAAEDQNRKTLVPQTPKHVTALGTVREIAPKVQIKENITEPMTYTEILKRREERIAENARRQRERGYNYRDEDYDRGGRRSWSSRRHDGMNDIDLSDVDDNYAKPQGSRYEGRGGDSYRGRYRDDYRDTGRNRYSGNNYSSGRVRARY